MYLVDYICGLICFWTTQVWGINYAKKQLMFIFSGAFIPISMFPEQLQSVLNFTPLPYTYSLPLEILLNEIPQGEYWEKILIQLIWCVLLYCLSRIVWNIGVKKVTIQGG